MTEDALLEHIFNRLAYSETGQAIFSASESVEWPDGALDGLTEAGLLASAQPARVIECRGCEENCVMPVHVFPAEGARPARAYIACDKRDTVGRVPVDMAQLRQWQISGAMLAETMTRLFGFTKPPKEDVAGMRWVLGLLQEGAPISVVRLSTEGGAWLVVAGQTVPLVQILTLHKRRLEADRSALQRFAESASRQPESGLGSAEWRKQTAKAAANARHNQPGGSRDKQQRIREVWATGKYSSRDRCAEEECAALNMSYSAARKALINTPDP
jgi:hypothetical protein